MIEGFSKLSQDAKRKLIASAIPGYGEAENLLKSFRYSNPDVQRILDEAIENTVSNFHLPYAVAPNFIINGKEYIVPLVTEESSVVAAIASGARFWAQNGGFHTRVLSENKTGQVHFLWNGKPEELMQKGELLENFLREQTAYLTERMEKRGGGILQIQIRRNPSVRPDYYQLLISFGTGDAMGANFINTILERIAEVLKIFFHQHFPDVPYPEIIMAILSNYTPECVAEVEIAAPFAALGSVSSGLSPGKFAERFVLAVEIAEKDVFRAVTHNKGIMNGIDAVVLATGNDFRAVDAAAHAWAARNGRYESLSKARIEKDFLMVKISVPLSLGTTGGLTSLHPLAAFSIKLLGSPSARELMQIAVATGMASHFSAIRALITTGIQKGHMKMHLSNILNSLKVTGEERQKAEQYFRNFPVSYTAVRDYIEMIRNSG